MSSLEKIIETQSKTIEIIANELTLLREQVEYLRQKLYGKSSEKVVHQPGQLKQRPSPINARKLRKFVRLFSVNSLQR